MSADHALDKALKDRFGKGVNIHVIIDGEPAHVVAADGKEGSPAEEGSESIKEEQDELGMAPKVEDSSHPSAMPPVGKMDPKDIHPMGGPLEGDPLPDLAGHKVAEEPNGRKPMGLHERAQAAKMAAQKMLNKK